MACSERSRGGIGQTVKSCAVRLGAGAYRTFVLWVTCLPGPHVRGAAVGWEGAAYLLFGTFWQTSMRAGVRGLSFESCVYLGFFFFFFNSYSCIYFWESASGVGVERQEQRIRSRLCPDGLTAASPMWGSNLRTTRS